MLPDVRLQNGVRHALLQQPVPPPNIAEIMRRNDDRAKRSLTLSPGKRAATAAAAIFIAGAFLTARSPALVQNVQQRYREALVAMGIRPMPSPPRALLGEIKPEMVTLAQAQKRANFHVVAPAGLPSDVVARKIMISPLAVANERGDWHFTGSQITFEYRRASGATIVLVADRYSPLDVPYPRYIYRQDGVTASGMPIVRDRYEDFVWRNGDQVLRAQTSDGLTVREIAAIRSAMRGVALPRDDGKRRVHTRGRMKLFVHP